MGGPGKAGAGDGFKEKVPETESNVTAKMDSLLFLQALQHEGAKADADKSEARTQSQAHVHTKRKAGGEEDSKESDDNDVVDKDDDEDEEGSELDEQSDPKKSSREQPGAKKIKTSSTAPQSAAVAADSTPSSKKTVKVSSANKRDTDVQQQDARSKDKKASPNQSGSAQPVPEVKKEKKVNPTQFEVGKECKWNVFQQMQIGKGLSKQEMVAEYKKWQGRYAPSGAAAASGNNPEDAAATSTTSPSSKTSVPPKQVSPGGSLSVKPTSANTGKAGVPVGGKHTHMYSCEHCGVYKHYWKPLFFKHQLACAVRHKLIAQSGGDKKFSTGGAANQPNKGVASSREVPSKAMGVIRTIKKFSGPVTHVRQTAGPISSSKAIIARPPGSSHVRHHYTPVKQPYTNLRSSCKHCGREFGHMQPKVISCNLGKHEKCCPYRPNKPESGSSSKSGIPPKIKAAFSGGFSGMGKDRTPSPAVSRVVTSSYKPSISAMGSEKDVEAEIKVIEKKRQVAQLELERANAEYEEACLQRDLIMSRKY